MTGIIIAARVESWNGFLFVIGDGVGNAELVRVMVGRVDVVRPVRVAEALIAVGPKEVNCLLSIAIGLQHSDYERDPDTVHFTHVFAGPLVTVANTPVVLGVLA